MAVRCDIVAVGKRRDGGTRYWCLRHRANATAKYGTPALRCRDSLVPVVPESEVLQLDLREFEGGVGLWGAVAPVYDTTTRGLDKGIHVHARSSVGGSKVLDRTVRRLCIIKPGGSEDIEITELDAIYFMASNVFGVQTRYIVCSYCRFPHLDKDWFSVHPHRRHLCAACGRVFRDTMSSVGNPACRAESHFSSVGGRRVVRSRKAIALRQSDYPGGIQIWGSNPSIIWTSKSAELSGIHVHAYRELSRDAESDIDETFGSVSIDGTRLDATHVRRLMAQKALPHLSGRVICIRCERCGLIARDVGEHAFTPRRQRSCERCGALVRSKGRYRNVVVNPLLPSLDKISVTAVRPPRVHDLGLVPEAP